MQYPSTAFTPPAAASRSRNAGLLSAFPLEWFLASQDVHKPVNAAGASAGATVVDVGVPAVVELVAPSSADVGLGSA